MSQILEVLRPGAAGDNPTLRLQCSGCGRKYVTKQNRWNAERQTRCALCRPYLGGKTDEGTSEVQKRKRAK